jgi:hypothetical protein
VQTITGGMECATSFIAMRMDITVFLSLQTGENIVEKET